MIACNWNSVCLIFSFFFSFTLNGLGSILPFGWQSCQVFCIGIWMHVSEAMYLFVVRMKWSSFQHIMCSELRIESARIFKHEHSNQPKEFTKLKRKIIQRKPFSMANGFYYFSPERRQYRQQSNDRCHVIQILHKSHDSNAIFSF